MTYQARLIEFFALMKPRVRLLAVFTTLVVLIAPTHPDLHPGSVVIVASARGKAMIFRKLVENIP